ncbi:MAG: type II and III secretion system protein family protein [Planctomycetaceae bacterium]|nr:type II and III secretion system protein family protein [Planctomycetaceae bacterium]
MPNLKTFSTRMWVCGMFAAAGLANSAIAQELPPPPSFTPPPSSSTTPTSPPKVTSPPPVLTEQEVQPGEEIFQVVTSRSKITMTHLDSQVVELVNRIRIVDGFNADKINISALSPHRIRIKAENPGVTTVKLIDELDGVYHIEVFVEPDTRELQAYLDRLFPGTYVEVIGVKEGVVLKGWVTEPTQIPQIMAVAEQFYAPESINSQLSVGGVSQVQLNVQIVEIQRSKVREMGFNWLLVGQQYFLHSGVGGIGLLGQAEGDFGGPPSVTLGSNTFGNEFNFAITGSNNVFQGFLKALQSEALAKILAEPKLVTTSGRPATLLSGGEFPILVPQSLGSVTTEWREFGVRMEAVPIVLGNGRLRLDIAPEVSERDFSNAVSVNGLVVPGITVRRVNTQVEMRFGETLMIGGLISTRRTGTTQKVPFLGELPFVGTFFSRKDYTFGETELLIMVTPQLVAPMQPHQVPCGRPGFGTDIPTDKELYFDGMLEVPVYGPDCPSCEPFMGHLITPDDVLRPCPDGNCGPGTLPPTPIQQTSGTANPHQSVQQAISSQSEMATSRLTESESWNSQDSGKPVRPGSQTRSKIPTGKMAQPGLVKP